MIASIHITDLSPRQVPRVLAEHRRTRREPVEGLIQTNIAIAAPLSASVIPRPTPRRLVLVQTWENDDALDVFHANARLAAHFDDGWHVRLEPIRITGQWPGIALHATSDNDPYDGPVVVLTLGYLRLRRAVKFFRASARAEGQILAAPGVSWGTGFGMLPFVGTCSLWTDAPALLDYAYNDPTSGHGQAMAANRVDAFHHSAAFIRFRPYAPMGQLRGRNPLARDLLAPRSTEDLDDVHR
jgi:hypothetical protein